MLHAEINTNRGPRTSGDSWSRRQQKRKARVPSSRDATDSYGARHSGCRDLSMPFHFEVPNALQGNATVAHGPAIGPGQTVISAGEAGTGVAGPIPTVQ